MKRRIDRKPWVRALIGLGGLGLLALGVSLVTRIQAAPPASSEMMPKFKFDPDWPKPLPNKWKMGGVTGLSVDKDDNVWVYDRPNDLTTIEVEAELNPPDRKSVV